MVVVGFAMWLGERADSGLLEGMTPEDSAQAEAALFWVVSFGMLFTVLAMSFGFYMFFRGVRAMEAWELLSPTDRRYLVATRREGLLEAMDRLTAEIRRTESR